jgi:glycerophosphoryl diester phosphodiesterase
MHYSVPTFFKTGHRGYRGLYSENTINGFFEAIKAGVNALEFDVVVSMDRLLVVSHEPYMNHEICLKPDGSEIKQEEEKEYNLYKMSYSEIKKFDCGSKIHSRFPKQKKEKAHKPLLSVVIAEVEKFLKENNLPSVLYDVEIKSEASEYGISQPSPEDFAEMLAEFIFQNNLSQKAIVRSFDVAPLQYLHKKYKDLLLALIVENNLSVKENLKQLGFLPFMYSPEYVLINNDEMDFLRENNILIVPWTVNKPEEIEKLLKLGVNGIITDYPDLFKTMGI